MMAMSPSSRRAWIEIWLKDDLYNDGYVAILAEGVDRNLVLLPGVRRENGSPSSRRAWIEIPSYWSKATEAPVALLAEGVDRNNNKAIPDLMKMVALLAEGVDRNSMVFPFSFTGFSRPPRGGRG